jgi:hypothetical protein
MDREQLGTGQIAMPEVGSPPGQEPPPPEAMVQVPPRGPTRSFNEMNKGQTVFGIQGTVGELKEAIAALSRTVESGFARLDALERSAGKLKDTLRSMVPKLDDCAGFYKHRVSALPDKSDLLKIQAELKSEIEKRPTRR